VYDPKKVLITHLLYFSDDSYHPKFWREAKNETDALVNWIKLKKQRHILEKNGCSANQGTPPSEFKET
jgi:hypothetical protein